MEHLISEAPSSQVQAWFKYLAPTHIVKRDGSTVAFHAQRIRATLLCAGRSTGEYDQSEAELLEHRVMKVLRHRFSGLTPSVEQVQDIVEQTLVDADYLHTFRACVAYRAQHQRLRDDRRALADVVASIDGYLDRADWRVKANADRGDTLGGLILDVAGKVVANYWLAHVYPPEVAQAHRDAEMHIDDLGMLRGRGARWSLRKLLHEGLNGVPGKAEAAPPRHFASALGQMADFLAVLQNEWSGAQEFGSVDTFLAPLVRADQLSYAQVHQDLQQFVHRLNVPTRCATQSPSPRLAFDGVCPDELRDQAAAVGGQQESYTYGELQAEMDLINRAFIDVMNAGDRHGRAFASPTPTYRITRDFPRESPNAERLLAMFAKYALPCARHLADSHRPPRPVRPVRRHRRIELREFSRRGSIVFASADQTGSIGMVTINCARLGYLHRGAEPALMARIDRLAQMARDSLEIKRKLIRRLIDDGLFPYTRRYLGTLRDHFSTVGVCGINEMVRNFSSPADAVASPEGTSLAQRVLDRLGTRLREFERETGTLYQLESTLAAETSCRLAKEDRRRLPGILQAGTDERPDYTNPSPWPPDCECADVRIATPTRQHNLQTRGEAGPVLCAIHPAAA